MDAFGVDLRDLPSYVQEKAAAAIRRVTGGEATDPPMKRMVFDRNCLTLPLTHDYRLLIVQDDDGCHPVAAVGHEEFDSMAKNASKKGWKKRA
jgi:hypothetical protein